MFRFSMWDNAPTQPVMDADVTPIRSSLLRPLLGVLALALILRVAGVVWKGQAPPMWDAAAVHGIGVDLVSILKDPGQLPKLIRAMKGKSDREKEEIARQMGFKDLPNILWRGPGYPALLSVFYVLAGPDYRIGQVLNIVFGVLTIWLIFLLGRNLFEERAGLWAAGLCAVMPQLIQMTPKLHTETFGIFLMILGLWFLSEGVQGKAWYKPVLGGLVLGMAGLTRISLNMLYPFLAVVMAGLALVNPTLRWRLLKTAALSAAAFFIVAAAWTAVNWKATGKARYSLGGYPGLMLYTGTNHYANNYVNTDYAQDWNPSPQLSRIMKQKHRPKGQPEDVDLAEATRLMIREEPGMWIAGNVKKLYFYYTRPADEAREGFPFSYTSQRRLQTALLVLALLAFLWVGWGGGWLCLGVLGYLTAGFFIVLFDPRYNLPALPVLALLSAFTLTRIWDQRNILKKNLAKPGLLALGLGAVGCAWLSLNVIQLLSPGLLLPQGIAWRYTLAALAAVASCYWLASILEMKGVRRWALLVLAPLSAFWVHVAVTSGAKDAGKFKVTIPLGAAARHTIDRRHGTPMDNAWLAVELCRPASVNDVRITLNGRTLKETGQPQPVPPHGYSWRHATIKLLGETLQKRQMSGFPQWAFYPLTPRESAASTWRVDVFQFDSASRPACLMADLCTDQSCNRITSPIVSTSGLDVSWTKFLTEDDFRMVGETRLKGRALSFSPINAMQKNYGAPWRGAVYRIRVVSLDKSGSPRVLY